MDRGLGALGLPAFDEEALLRQFARDEDGDVNQPQAPQIGMCSFGPSPCPALALILVFFSSRSQINYFF